jgi:hypothetical protein
MFLTASVSFDRSTHPSPRLVLRLSGKIRRALVAVASSQPGLARPCYACLFNHDVGAMIPCAHANATAERGFEGGPAMCERRGIRKIALRGN